MSHELIKAKITEDHLNVLEGEHFSGTPEMKEWNDKQFFIILINQPEHLEATRPHPVKSGEF